MTIIFDNDKISFSEWNLEDRERTIADVLTELGTSYAYDSFLDALRARGDELGIDLESVDWFAEGVFESTDAVYDNAGESVSSALFEIAALVYATTELTWDGALADTLNQVYPS